MGWQPVARQDLPSLLDFLLADEWRCVPFTANLKRSFHPRTRVYSRITEEGIDGALMITAGGLLLPVFGRPGPVLFPHLDKVAAGLHSIMGIGSDVRAVEECLPAHPSASVDYHLMSLESRRYRPSRLPAMPGLHIRPARPQDVGRLFPLQQAYELEEVVIHPELYHRQESYLHLRQALHRETILMAELHGRPVAKAGTNARGYRASQVGGVFTLPEERNRGIGLRVMEELLRRIFVVHDCACLFVKKSNPAAQALYHRLGFRIRDDYRISYFDL